MSHHLHTFQFSILLIVVVLLAYCSKVHSFSLGVESLRLVNRARPTGPGTFSKVHSFSLGGGHPLRLVNRARPAGAGTFQMTTSHPPTYSGPLCFGKKAIIFDIDGTLADSFRLAFSATNDVLQSNGFAPVSEAEYHFGSRFTTPIRLARHAGLDPDGDAEEFVALGTKLGQEFDNLYIGKIDPAGGKAGFYPGIFDLINDIPENVKVGALTNAAVAYAEEVLKANGVRERFAVVHGADDVAAPKPAPDGVLQCCHELGVAPADAVYVGDAPSDGRAARAAGCSSVGVTWGASSAPALAAESVRPDSVAQDGMVSTVEQLREALLGAGSGGGGGASTRFPAHVLLDRDGVINADVGAPGVLRAEQLQVLPGVAEGMRRLKEAGCHVSIVTCVQDHECAGRGRAED